MSRYLDPKSIDEKTTTISEESAYTPSELTIYEAYWDNVSREKTLMMDKFTEGQVIGEAKGEIKGRIDERREISKNMLKYGVDIETIIKTTGLTQKELEQIKAGL